MTDHYVEGQAKNWHEMHLEQMIMLPRTLKPETCASILKTSAEAKVPFPPNIERLLREIASTDLT